MNEHRNREIEKRAHEIWALAGRPHGMHEEHWHQAEAEIAAQESATGKGRGEPAGRAAEGTSSRKAAAPQASLSAAKAETGKGTAKSKGEVEQAGKTSSDTAAKSKSSAKRATSSAAETARTKTQARSPNAGVPSGKPARAPETKTPAAKARSANPK